MAAIVVAALPMGHWSSAGLRTSIPGLGGLSAFFDMTIHFLAAHG